MGPRLSEFSRGVVFSALRVVDIVWIMIAFGAAANLSVNGVRWIGLAEFFASKVSLWSCVLFVFAVLMCHAMFSLCGLYESKRLSSKHAEAFDVFRAMALSTAFLWLEGKVFSILLISPQFLLAFLLSGSFLIICTRLILRLILSGIRKRGRNLHHVLVFGTNPRAVAFGRNIEAMPSRGYRLLGFADDNWAGMAQFEASGMRLACSGAGLADFLRHNVVDEVAIYLPLRSFYERAAEIANLARQHGILTRFDTDIFDLKPNGAASESAEVVDAVSPAHQYGIDGWHLALKRLLDIVGSLAALLVLTPLLVVVAVLIKVTSRGPIIFSQKRVGLNKRQFTMYKFRTMVPGAETLQNKLLHLNEMSGPVFKMKNDPRITRIGRILRRTSIDELPQLFNVLRGDMSLVGPRAMSVRDYQFFNEDWQRRRFSVLPGITCLWQINGRNTIPFEQWMVLDMQYIDKWSFWLDLKILALTIPAVFRGLGAG